MRRPLQGNTDSLRVYALRGWPSKRRGKDLRGYEVRIKYICERDKDTYAV